GHGTHIAGIIGASTDNARGVAAVAPGVSLMPLKVAASDGRGKYSDVIEGILHAADAGARVINLSIGGYSFSQVLSDAVAYAHSKGAVLVAAAGNDDSDEPLYPAAYPNVLAVAATDDSDGIWVPSNQGAYVDLAAPGVGLLSAFPGDRYGSGTGTSGSAAFVSGTAALVLSSNPALANSQVEQVLVSTATDIGRAGRDTESGAGRVNARAALASEALDVRDLAVTYIGIEHSEFSAKESPTLVVTIQNQGTHVEATADVTAYRGDLQIGRVSLARISPTEEVTVRFAFEGRREPSHSNFEVSATVSTVPGEDDVSDNERSRAFQIQEEDDVARVQYKQTAHQSFGRE
ncbi:MAG: S8 family serine peptidase, partial [bacterium]